MDKGKKRVAEWTDSESDHSSSNSNIGPLKKPRIMDWDREMEKKEEEIEYWRHVYAELYMLHQDHKKWAREEMEKMTSKHRAQCATFKSMAASNRLYFHQRLKEVSGQLEEIYQQLKDATSNLELKAQDHINEQAMP